MPQETKHTPGPWETASLAIYGKRNIKIAQCLDDDCEETWGKAVCAPQMPEFDTAEANARLIAAAPELLGACKALLTVARIYDKDLAALGKARNMSGVPGFQGGNIFEAVADIIAKATGESA